MLLHGVSLLRGPDDPKLGLRFGLVNGGCLLSISITLYDSGLRRLNALDAAPALAILGHHLAHFFDRMMDTTTIAVSGLSHVIRSPDRSPERQKANRPVIELI